MWEFVVPTLIVGIGLILAMAINSVIQSQK